LATSSGGASRASARLIKPCDLARRSRASGAAQPRQ
jgi:hypothetical protein